jgi:hypothetical protein
MNFLLENLGTNWNWNLEILSSVEHFNLFEKVFISFDSLVSQFPWFSRQFFLNCLLFWFDGSNCNLLFFTTFCQLLWIRAIFNYSLGNFLEQPWATQIGSRAKFMLKSQVEGQNWGLFFRFSRYFYEIGIFQRL